MGQEHADMIHGIGTDIVVIDRIAEIITRHGDRFINRIYTDLEQKAADSRKDQARFYAMRFAAKEAAWKALSPARSLSIGWHDFEIISTEEGKPELFFRGEAERYFDEKTNGKGKTYLSLSDDGGMALAFVTLSTS